MMNLWKGTVRRVGATLLACVLLLGLPLMIAEFTVGRASHRNAVGAYRALNPRWSFLGYNGVLAAFLILGFYFVVSGWTAEYMVHSVTGSIARFSTAEQYKSLFENFISNPWSRSSTPACSSSQPIS